ncbi:MAG TPA: polysaccharide biosynthesis protein, partial [bacterium]|nr:polysaccharide biosynthesis protein [bacterium]
DKGEKTLPITDSRMTRFWITLDQGVDLVFKAIEEAKGGEIYVSKIPSFKVVDLAKAMSPSAELKEIGIREGEKLHEVMVSEEDSMLTYDYGNHYIIYPNFEWWDLDKHFKKGGTKVKSGFIYSSGSNSDWLSVDDMKESLKTLEIVF